MTVICSTCGHTADMHNPDCPPQHTWLSARPLREGWVCPKCGKVYGPHVDECYDCNFQLSLEQGAIEMAAAAQKPNDAFVTS